MEKSVFTREYRILQETLRAARRKANLTQVELAKKLGQSQSFVSRYERGETRLDLVQLRTVCIALGTSLASLVQGFERRLRKR